MSGRKVGVLGSTPIKGRWSGISSVSSTSKVSSFMLNRLFTLPDEEDMQDLENDPRQVVLTEGKLPDRVKNVEYAVRGKVLYKSWEINKQLKDDPGSLPFTEVTRCNIGNPQAVGQTPITYIKKFASVLVDPSLLDDFPDRYPSDIADKARKVLSEFPKFGAYSESKGIKFFREVAAEWMTERDGYPTDPEDIIYTNGASMAIRTVLELLVDGYDTGILIPIPQYPLYTASLVRLGARPIGYYLQEEKNWGLSVSDLQEALEDARENGVKVMGLVVINPSNPTGTVLTRQEMEEIVRFCEKNRLVILADEVYQENIYSDEKPFISFRKVAADLNVSIEVFSFHSASKGIKGNCGFRGGMVHCMNLDNDVMAQLYKLFSLSLCANTVGQAIMAAQLTPPKPFDPSYAQYEKERSAIFDSLKRKAKLVSEKLNTVEGYSCQPVEGAMYAFPRFELPDKAIAAADEEGQKPDLFYCLRLLERTGVVAVPGSGFGQREGTYHYRLTILPEESKFEGMLDRIKAFHEDFIKEFS